MKELLEKLNKKENELRGKLQANLDGEISSIVYELSTLEEIRSIVLAGEFYYKLIENKIDWILNNLSDFAYNAKFEITADNFEYALNQVV